MSANLVTAVKRRAAYNQGYASALAKASPVRKGKPVLSDARLLHFYEAGQRDAAARRKRFASYNQTAISQDVPDFSGIGGCPDEVVDSTGAGVSVDDVTTDSLSWDIEAAQFDLHLDHRDEHERSLAEEQGPNDDPAEMDGVAEVDEEEGNDDPAEMDGVADDDVADDDSADDDPAEQDEAEADEADALE